MKRIALFPLAILVACGGSDSGKSGASLTNNGSGNPITAPVDYLGAVNQGRRKAVSQINLNHINSTLQQFALIEGKQAESLDELIKKGYLQSLPVLPKGMELIYDLKSGQVAVTNR